MSAASARALRGAPLEPKSEKRKQRHVARREEILDAAMALIVEDGVDALTMPGLAKRLDAGVGALYRYFSGKQELMVALQKRALVGFGVLVHEAVAAVSGGNVEETVLARIVAAAWAYRVHGLVEPTVHRLLDAVMSDPRALLSLDEAAEVNQTLATILGEVGSLLEEAVTLGVLVAGDTAQRVHVLWAAVHGLDHFAKRDRMQPAELQSAVLLTEMLRALLVGWGAEPLRVNAALASVSRP